MNMNDRQEMLLVANCLMEWADDMALANDDVRKIGAVMREVGRVVRSVARADGSFVYYDSDEAWVFVSTVSRIISTPPRDREVSKKALGT